MTIGHLDIPGAGRAKRVAFFAAVLICGVLAWPTVAPAVDGFVDAGGTHQEGRSGPTAFSSDSRRLFTSLSQRVNFSRRLQLMVRYGSSWETQENRTVNFFSSYEKRVRNPYASLTFKSGDFNLGLTGNGSRSDFFRFEDEDNRDDLLNTTGWLNGDLGPVDLTVRGSRTWAWREQAGGEAETQAGNVGVNVRTRLSRQDRLRYNYSLNTSRVMSTDYRTRFDSHTVEYAGNRQFNEDRGRVSLNTKYTWMDQEVRFGGEGDLSYQAPDWGGYVLDDTPEFLDPLEPDPIEVPALHDLDRDTATRVNIGDSAPQVREFGGDYRNVIFDFGDPAPMSSATLFIDRTLAFPELIQWRVYVTDDVEGRDWGPPLAADRVTAVYRELPSGRQGWAFTFNTPLTHRYVKFVNVKFGVTEEDIFLTEVEIYGPAEASGPDVDAQSTRFQVTGSAGYRIAPTVDVRYRGMFRNTDFAGGSRKENRATHLGEVTWSRDGWQVYGHASVNLRDTESGRNTEVYNQKAGVQRNVNRNLRFKVGWSRDHDVSYGRDFSTQNVAGDLHWRPAPALRLSQKVSYGRRIDDVHEISADSWATVTEINGAPRRSVSLRFRRVDRWVSQEAGVGFTTYNDTDLQVGWSIFPQLHYSVLGRHTVRETSYQTLRQFLSLSPLPGGSLTMNFFASDFLDTRNDSRNQSVGAQATWRPRPRLRVEGSVQVSNFEQAGSRSNPTSYQFRGNWSF